MLDKLNGILVKDTVIELLKSYLAGWLSVAAQKIQLGSPISQRFFLFCFFSLQQGSACACEGLPLPQDTVYNFGQTEECQAIKPCSHERGAL